MNSAELTRALEELSLLDLAARRIARPRQEQRRSRSRSPRNAPLPARQRRGSADRAPIVVHRPRDGPRPLQRAPSTPHRRPADPLRHPPRPAPRADSPPLPFTELSPQPAAPAPQAPVSQSGIFFDEGDGYLFVKALGRGADGCAVLVRSVVDDKLYVRKEDLRYQMKPLDNPNFPNIPPLETAHARKVRQLSGVYKAHGWARWEDEDKESFSDKCKELAAPIPESWAALWIVSMIDTMIKVQKAGIVHNDCHHGNWLVQTTPSGIPEIILGDFGRSQKAADLHPQIFLRQCVDDMFLLLGTFCHAVGLVHDRQDRKVWRALGSHFSSNFSYTLSKLAIATSSRYHHITQLHEACSKISAEIFQLHCQGLGETIHPATEPMATYSFMTGNEVIDEMRKPPSGFKQWRHAKVVKNVILTRSTKTLIRLRHQNGQWFDRMTGEPKFVVK